MAAAFSAEPKDIAATVRRTFAELDEDMAGKVKEYRTKDVSWCTAFVRSTARTAPQLLLCRYDT